MTDSQICMFSERMCTLLDEIRERHPLVHNITNYVVMNFTANVLLALGASPIMAHAPEEVEEIVGLSNALVINIGTLSSPWVSSMTKAAKAAANRSVPILLDPVGAGATRFRTETAREIIAVARPSIIRGNASEILALAGERARTKGVDSANSTDEAYSAALCLARETSSVVAVTGAEDLVTDGTRSVRINNGHPLMGRVTGTGCSATAIMGAFCAVEPDALIAATGALVAFGISGELAAQSNPGPGTFQALLLDQLDALSSAILKERMKLRISKA
jgi:hydroxyethylthiazole kinase